MSLLISENALVERKAAAAGPLLPLAASLAADLEPLRSSELYFPTKKALLSREGGRCARDGTLLTFDPFSPNEHRCPVCGEVYRGELHDRFWIYSYQLWLAERAVHAAALYRLNVDDRLRTLACDILEGYIDRYSSYPNVDNVLGPSRLFFSTYIESIWLLQVCVATDLLDAVEPRFTARLREHIIEPARAIITVYDEGASNRQVWNDAALLAASRLLGDTQGIEQAIFGPSGVESHLSGGLLPDGTWYEGENYHLFAHRGLWYGVTMAEQGGFLLPPRLIDRFQRGFVAPFLTALPDLTFPSRRDSQYAVSLRQWRIAEHCELGFARRPDPELGAALYRLYHDDVPRRDPGRRTSTADAERNALASSLTRADLNWRALLCALPELPDLRPEAAGARSAILDAQGLAVFRRNAGRTYVALDYGHSGGGHGHPDRLNLLIADGNTRWLDDPGTGSYVDPSLHWYRSTMAHNAPLVDGHSQVRKAGELVAYDERDVVGWVVAKLSSSGSDSPHSSSSGSEATGGSPITTSNPDEVTIIRTIVVTNDYLIDELAWGSAVAAVIDLPIHTDLVLRGADRPTPDSLLGGTDLEDGFRFLRDTTRQHVAADTLVLARAVSATEETLTVWAKSDQDTDWWRALSFGPPGSADEYFRILRSRGVTGRHRLVFAWSSSVVNAQIDENIEISLADGTTHRHARNPEGWLIELQSDDSERTITLDGVVERAPEVPLVVDERPVPDPLTLSRHRHTIVQLGEPHYRRSEQAWHEAGQPRGSLTFERTDHALRLIIEVSTSELTFVPADATNPYDNEPPDINGDSIQLYLRSSQGFSGWMLIPTLESVDVRQRILDGWNAPHALRATWERTDAGYRVTVELDSIPEGIDVIVNEMPRGRERRRGQLVLSGAAGEFVYLRGDRHDHSRLIPIKLDDQ